MAFHVLKNNVTTYTLAIMDGVSWLDADTFCKRHISTIWTANSHTRWSSIFERFSFILNQVDAIFIGLKTNSMVSNACVLHNSCRQPPTHLYTITQLSPALDTCMQLPWSQ